MYFFYILISQTCELKCVVGSEHACYAILIFANAGNISNFQKKINMMIDQPKT